MSPPHGLVARRGLGRGQIALFAVLLLLVVVTESLGARSFAELGEASRRFDLAQNVTGNLADAQRDALRLRLLLEAEPVVPEDALLQSQFLQRQLSQLRSRRLGGSDGAGVDTASEHADEVADGLQAVVDAAPDARADVLEMSLPALRRHAAGAEEPLRGLYVRFENDFYTTAALDLAQRRDETAVVLAAAALAVAIAAALALSVRRVVVQDFQAAMARLVREQERRTAAQEAVSLTERRFAALVRRADEVILVLDDEGSITFASPSVARLTGGADPADLIGRLAVDLLVPADRTRALAAARRVVTGQDDVAQVDVRVPRRHASDGWFAVSITDCRADPAVAGLVVNAHDVTDRAEHAAWLEHLAYHERLTGLPNRLAVERRLDEASAARERTIVVVLDLDGFGAVLDDHGQAGADEALVATAAALERACAPVATVAHFGTDVFAVLSPADRDRTDDLVRRIQQALSAGVQVAGTHRSFTAGIGALVSNGLRGAEALRTAESAMHDAKRSGRGEFVLHDESRLDQLAERTRLVEALRAAPAAGDLLLHHQPLVDLRTGQVTGTEALVRWERGGTTVPPAEFVPVAEETGLIVPVGSWVLEQACADLATLDAMGRTSLRVNVNVSARQLAEPRFASHVADVLAAQGTDPGRLVLELTESAVVDDPGHVTRVLHDLRAAGHRIALDDFGTGYSSLSHLMRLPVDVVKLDRSFVGDIATSARTRQMVGALVDVCHDLGMTVTVEGIETDAQLDAVVAAGCDTGQGYLFARPAPLDQVAAAVGVAVPRQTALRA